MHTIKIHLETEEYQPVFRLAEHLRLLPEDLAYAGLNRIMQGAADPGLAAEVARLKAARAHGLPNWADRSREIHAYESMT
jgi:hypothetical protein